MAHAPSASPARLTRAQADGGEAPLRGRRLRLLQALWLVLVLGDLAIFVVSVPAYYHALFSVCPGPLPRCPIQDQLNVQTLHTLHHAGFSLTAYALYVIVLDALATLPFLLIGAVIIWRKATTWMGLFVSFLLLNMGSLGLSYAHTGALPTASSTPMLTVLNLVGTPLTILYYPCLAFFFFTFPDGRLVPRWSWALLGLWVVNTVFWTAPLDSPLQIERWPPLLEAGWLFVVFGGSACTQLYRFLRVASPLQRQQIKWLLYGFMPVLLWPLGLTLYMTFVPALNRPGAYLLNTPNSLLLLVVLPLYRFWYLPVPCCIGIALLRYRLWDIDLLINRTLVYGALTAGVIGLYVLLVGYLGAAFHASGNPAISLLATGVVAVLFQPLRGRVQRGVDRLMFGERDNPYGVLARLDQRLALALPAEAVLPTIVETVATALKLPYAAVTLVQQGPPAGGDETGPSADTGERVVASYGAPAAAAVRLPLVYGAETVGYLHLVPRPGETAFAPADRRLLADLAAHTGVVVHAVRLSDDLRRAHERLVTTREEERRRLRRDLHDGLGPQLASLALTLTAARAYLARDPATADALLREMGTHVQDAIADVRRLVYALRPPALDDLGLDGALRDQALRYARGGLRVRVEVPAPLPALPAAVEVAAYRIGLEALTNVARHAQATACVIRLCQDASALNVEIADDGGGIAAAPPAGVGLRSMRERAEELGGSLVVAPAPGGGTRVLARLPLMEAQDE